MSSNKTNWYLRKPDGSEYGPISTSDLQRWAAQCRLVAGNGVSSDREEWIKVEDIPELEMDWIAHRPDGSEYGPFNISATQELLNHKVIGEDATLTHKTTKKSVTVEQVLNEEDLFAEPEEQDENEEQILSEEALKEEALYAEIEKTETAEKAEEKPENLKVGKPETGAEVPAARTESASEREQTEQKNPVPDPQISKLQEKLQKTEDNLTQARNDLKSAQQEMTQTSKSLSEQHNQAQLKMAATIKTLTEERDQAQEKLIPLQNKLENAAIKQVKTTEANVIHCEELEAKLEEAVQTYQQTEAKFARLENERSEVENKSLQSVAELRKQTAFMKKNSSTLQHELENLQTISSRRGRQLIFMITGISIIAGIMLVTGKTSCRKAEKNILEPEPQITRDITEETPEETPLSQRPYNSGNTTTKTEKNETPTQSPQFPRPTLNASQLPASWPKFMIEGVKANESSKTCSLRFDSGVFTSNTTPSSDAIKQLQEISDILRPQMSNFIIIVEGCTDNIPMRTTSTYNGNHALGLARAETVKNILINKGRLPMSSITPRYAGENKAPYPNDTASNRKRNRTVILKLVKK